MPWQPPVLGGQRERRKAWARPVGQPDRRKRGRAGQRDRAQVIAEEPLCRLCLKRNVESPTEEVDHIVPLSAGGSDERRNKQGLCSLCHAAKTKAEDRARRA